MTKRKENEEEKKKTEVMMKDDGEESREIAFLKQKQRSKRLKQTTMTMKRKTK